MVTFSDIVFPALFCILYVKETTNDKVVAITADGALQQIEVTRVTLRNCGDHIRYEYCVCTEESLSEKTSYQYQLPVTLVFWGLIQWSGKPGTSCPSCPTGDDGFRTMESLPLHWRGCLAFHLGLGWVGDARCYFTV